MPVIVSAESSVDKPRAKPANGRAAPFQRQRGEQGRSIATRVDLVAAARDLFGTVGYHATGTPDIVARAQVTRGALYHHFAGKQGLFEEVFRQVALELLEEAQAATSAMTGQTSPRIVATLRIYLELISSRPHYLRILLIDGPAALGWERWRELRCESEYPGWVSALLMLEGQGVAIRAPAEALAHLIMAAIADAALAVAHAPDPRETLQDMSAALDVVLVGLTGQAGAHSTD